MIGREKSHFRWRDPDHNPKESSGIMKRSLFRLLVVAIISSTAFLILLQHRHDISITKPLIALAAIIVFMAMVYYVHARIPPYVVMKDTYMYRGLNDETADEWKYKDISNCAFWSQDIDGRVSNAMDIETKRGERFHFTIPPEVSVAAIRAFLREKGIHEQEGPNQADGENPRRTGDGIC